MNASLSKSMIQRAKLGAKKALDLIIWLKIAKKLIKSSQYLLKKFPHI